MARILADRDIRKLLGCVLINADEKCINPNGIELRLGTQVRFLSTGEEKELSPGDFLKVHPGETVLISSLETIDFSAATVACVYPESMLTALITPTTTMMREGISQAATKIDAGFRGILNWGLRNGSARALVIEYGEPIFKLTLFALESGEIPEVAYGQRDKDIYQDAKGIVRSARRVPADLPKSKVVCSSFAKLDPKKQLREAGYPFDHISTELVTLHGKFEVVSKDVVLLKDQFEKQGAELSGKIVDETRAISARIDELRQSLLERVETIFDRKFLKTSGIIVGAVSLMYGVLSFLQERSVEKGTIALLACGVAFIVWLITYFLTRKGGTPDR